MGTPTRVNGQMISQMVKCEYKNGKANGRGAKTFSNGDTIEGNWKDGEMYGKAFFKLGSDGNVWVMEPTE